MTQEQYEKRKEWLDTLCEITRAYGSNWTLDSIKAMMMYETGLYEVEQKIKSGAYGNG